MQIISRRHLPDDDCAKVQFAALRSKMQKRPVAISALGQFLYRREGAGERGNSTAELSGQVARVARAAPVRSNAPASLVQSDLTGAHRARQEGFNLVFLSGFIPGLQFEIVRVGNCTAKRKRNAMIQFKIDE